MDSINLNDYVDRKHYNKTETYNQEEVVNAIDNFILISIVDELPTENIKTNKLYLVLNQVDIAENRYDLYVYANDGWEKLDSLEFNIEDYYNSSQTDFLLSQKAEINHGHENVTSNRDGFMRMEDKAKLDTVETGATKTIIDSSLSSTSTNPVQNKVINNALTTHNHDSAYYKKSETMTSSAINTAISDGIANLELLKIVTSLPTTNIETNKIYVVASGGSVSGIYIRTNNVWKQIDSMENVASSIVTESSSLPVLNLGNNRTQHEINLAINEKLQDIIVGDVDMSGTHTHTLSQITDLTTATTSSNGLMSSGDKKRIDYSMSIDKTYTKSPSTASEYFISSNKITELLEGCTIAVYNYTIDNEDEATLKLNNFDAKPIYYKGRKILQGEFPYKSIGLFLYTTWSSIESGNGAWLLLQVPQVDSKHSSIKILANSDLNECTNAGWYHSTSNSDVNSMTNTPFEASQGSAFSMEVLYTYGCIQILYPYRKNSNYQDYDFYIRTNTNSNLSSETWSEWFTIQNSSNNRPISFIRDTVYTQSSSSGIKAKVLNSKFQLDNKYDWVLSSDILITGDYKSRLELSPLNQDSSWFIGVGVNSSGTTAVWWYDENGTQKSKTFNSIDILDDEYHHVQIYKRNDLFSILLDGVLLHQINLTWISEYPLFYVKLLTWDSNNGISAKNIHGLIDNNDNHTFQDLLPTTQYDPHGHLHDNLETHRLSEDSSLNECYVPGVYVADGDTLAKTITEHPYGNETSKITAFGLLVLPTARLGTPSCKQILYNYQATVNQKIWIRNGYLTTSNEQVWSEWYEIYGSHNFLPSNTTPLMDKSLGSVGVSNVYAREDHTHPKLYRYSNRTSSSGYIRMFKITINTSWVDIPLRFIIHQRTRNEATVCHLRFSNVDINNLSNTPLNVESLTHTGFDADLYVQKIDDTSFEVILKQSTKDDTVYVDINNEYDNLNITNVNTAITTATFNAIATSSLTKSTFVGYSLDEKTRLNTDGDILHPIIIPQNSDLNSYINPGFYYQYWNDYSSGILNKPNSENLAFSLTVERLTGASATNGIGGVKQTYTEYPINGVNGVARSYVRVNQSSNTALWGDWVEILSDKTVSSSVSYGENILTGTKEFTSPSPTNSTLNPTDNETFRGLNVRYSSTSSTANSEYIYNITDEYLESGGTYTLSFWAKATESHNYLYTYFYNPTGSNLNSDVRRIRSNSNYSTYSHISNYTTDGLTRFNVSSEWKRYFVVYQLGETTFETGDIKRISIRLYKNNDGADLFIAGVKFERGNIPSDWSPSPTDINVPLATSSVNGLLSKTDKAKLDGSRNIVYASIDNATSTTSVLKATSTATGIQLVGGTFVSLVYNTSKVNDEGASLDLNGLGAKPIYYKHRLLKQGELEYDGLYLMMYTTWATFDSSGVWVILDTPSQELTYTNGNLNFD